MLLDVYQSQNHAKLFTFFTIFSFEAFCTAASEWSISIVRDAGSFVLTRRRRARWLKRDKVGNGSYILKGSCKSINMWWIGDTWIRQPALFRQSGPGLFSTRNCLHALQHAIEIRLSPQWIRQQTDTICSGFNLTAFSLRSWQSCQTFNTFNCQN